MKQYQKLEIMVLKVEEQDVLTLSQSDSGYGMEKYWILDFPG